MKITSKTLMVGFETEVKLGNTEAIEMTLQHQAFIYENKDGSVGVDKLVDKKEEELANSGLEDKLKLVFRDKI
jgi:hypothetical protein